MISIWEVQSTAKTFAVKLLCNASNIWPSNLARCGFREQSPTKWIADSLLLLGVPLSLSKRTFPDALMHAPVHLDNSIRALSQEARKKPMHESVAPVWCTCKGHTLCASAPSDLAQCSIHELLRVGHEGGRLADLGHGRGDEVRLDTLDVYTVGLEFGSERGGPLLQESLAAGVGCEEGCGEEAAKGGHGEDKSTLARHHSGGDELRDTKRSHAVDHDDVVHLLLGCLDKWHGDAVTQAHIVDQYADVQAVNELLHVVVVGVLVLRKVHSQRLDGDLGAIFGGDIGGEGVELGLRTRDENEVVALSCKGEGELLANAVRSTSYEGPSTAGSKGA
jgi:hypothetical protein